ncbi:MAG: Glu/Leu/Phe/Val dehydrogenase dimerization domain-containing protein [Planctomycetota bacterium]
MTREGFEEVVALHDHRSGLRAFLALHDTSAGPAFGGVRRFPYATEKAALLDCLRLALAMSWKVALADIAGGGGKLVLLDHPELDHEAAYRHLGRCVERMGGRFYTGPDVGTEARELAWVCDETRFAALPGEAGAGDLAGATTLGAFAGVSAALRQLDGEEDWPRRTIVIQGLGAVGFRLAQRLTALGARVVASEIDDDRARAAREELGIQTVDAGTEYDVHCDVFAPCAMGGVLHDLTIQRLSCRSVVGAANNILARTRHGDHLHRRGILYVPDFVVNAGAVMRGAAFHLTGEATSDEAIEERVSALSAEILGRACEEGRAPAEVAAEEASERLARRRANATQA